MNNKEQATALPFCPSVYILCILIFSIRAERHGKEGKNNADFLQKTGARLTLEFILLSYQKISTPSRVFYTSPHFHFLLA